MHIRAGELPKNFRTWVQTRHMGLKNVPKKFGTPGLNLAPNLFGFNLIHTVLLGVPALVIWPWTNNPKRLGAKFGPGVPNFLGIFSRPLHIRAEMFLDFLDPQAVPLAQVGHMGPK